MTIESEPANSQSHNDQPQVLAIVGVGLLGGSVALAAKEREIADRVIGIGRNPDRLQAAVDAGVIDEFLTELPERDAPWTTVVIGTPVDRIAEDVRRIAAVSRPGTVITDVGSVKGSICDAVQAEDLPEGVSFVGAHPLAGSEKTGFEAATADLFDGKVTVVTPNPAADSANLAIRNFWERLGSRVIEMSPVDHDAALATTSHLPHVAASALADVLPEEFRQLAASGFRDTTRIAAGDPDLWVAILLANSDAVIASLAAFSESFGKFQAAIEKRDPDELKKLLQLAKRNRDAVEKIRNADKH
ncbi:MAG: prephenate dehydrogenase [Planctomycetaceae bacterium]|jgi:prephenate dehydrogenase